MTKWLFDDGESNAVCLDVLPDVDRCWCRPSDYAEIVGVDFGSRKAHWHKAKSGTHGTVSETDFMAWASDLPKQTLVVCESAHLAVPRRPQSLAQPMTESELLELYKRCDRGGVSLRLAAHSLSHRMRKWAADHFPDALPCNDKSDATDAASIALYVLNCNRVSLAKPPASFDVSAQRLYGQQVRKRANVVLNAERRNDYEGCHFEHLMRLMRNVITMRGLNGWHVFVASVVATVACETDGRLFLFTHNGREPGFWFWYRYVLMGSPWHHRAGTARSNIMRHSYPKFLRQFSRNNKAIRGEDKAVEKFADMTDEQNAARIVANNRFRSFLRDAYHACIDEAKKMNAGFVEATSIE